MTSVRNCTTALKSVAIVVIHLGVSAAPTLGQTLGGRTGPDGGNASAQCAVLRQAALENRIKTRSASEDDYAALAFIWACLGNTERSIETLRRGLALFPGSFTLHYELGVQLHQSKDEAGAVIELREVFKSPTLGCSAKRLAAQAQAQTGPMALTERYYVYATECSPHDTELLAEFGEVLVREREWEKAYKVFLRCLELTPANARCAKGFGEVATDERLRTWRERRYGGAANSEL